MLGTASCPDRFTLSPAVDLAAAAGDLNTGSWCLTWFDQDWNSCEFGDPAGTNGTYALVGDSHAAAMVAALGEYFATRGIKLVTFTRFGCSGLNVTPAGASDTTGQGGQERACRVWTARVQAKLASRSDISRVIYTNYTSSYMPPDRTGEYELSVDDIVTSWKAVLNSGKSVVVVKDPPRTAGKPVPECLAAFVGSVAPCSTNRADSNRPDVMDKAVESLGGAVRSIDLSDAFCDSTKCYSVIGSVVVYADRNHISGTYARTLMPYLGPQLTE
jgi:hypothetical protein